MDKLTPEQRHKTMAAVKGKNTKIEILVRKYLFSKGFRYRNNVAALPGKPDIVFSKMKTVIFVHGCFWHGHEGCKRATLPITNVEYWASKIAKNVERDKHLLEVYDEMGWTAITIMECELTPKFRESTLEALVSNLNSIRGFDKLNHAASVPNKGAIHDV